VFQEKKRRDLGSRELSGFGFGSADSAGRVQLVGMKRTGRGRTGIGTAWENPGVRNLGDAVSSR
jgi:hypothetical protein